MDLIPQDPFDAILALHDKEHATGDRPVVCASCHADPALGSPGTAGTPSLSLAMHKKHSQQSPEPVCLDCHPGAVTQCSRSSAHSASDGNCTACHGTLDQVAVNLEAGRTPWLQEPSCSSCHSSVAGVETGNTLYRNAEGHGSLSCAACHGSPHAMVPTQQVAGYPNSDGYQSQQYQGYTEKVKSIGSCGVCHRSSRGASETGDFAEEHGGTNPDQPIGCSACHSSVPANTAQWPHSFQWHNSNG